ncbi:response regulator transcription factor [Roseateles sp. YR242]|uniref:response regulator n=1 Tax=Roseateles sp. YR242 TaxID=1855305 RepID=UPI000B8186AF|nr:response regulator transcription factor [Roseateles sp. YR242]
MNPSSPHSPLTRVLIVEDEPEFLRRFSEAVLADEALSLMAAVSSAAAALAVIAATPPDVVLLDLGLPDRNGIDVIREVASRWPECEVLVVTMFGDDDHVFEALAAGASGYLLKDFRVERIAASIHDLRAGGAPITPSIARRVLARMRAPPAASPSGSPIGASTGSAVAPGSTAEDALIASTRAASNTGVEALGTDSLLTPREIELLKLTAKGLSFDTVAELLGISPHTVVAHVKKIYRKLAVHSRSEAVYEATQMGLL